ncbi:glutathione synthetase-like [Crassostrea virginica]|uniref:Glutathione synthetase n=1 Tax=Crassostrea virginica TaxID=6565 RepID=A0A8B8F055_CRAVI|nr:glutathione synthetase-like [Crassostrea virginica]
MATVLEGTKIEEKKLQEIVACAKDRAMINGALMRTKEDPGSSTVVNHAPFTLLPSVVPQNLMKEAKGIQKSFNLLMHRVAHDHQFLEQALQNVIKVDDFTRQLWEIYITLREEGIKQPVSLGLFRNDFMMDTKKMEKNTDCSLSQIGEHAQLKQIEFNTIASSFAGLVGALSDVHRYTVAKAKLKCTKSQLPQNDPALGLSRGLVKAWQHYGNKNAAILFVSSVPERNRMDHVWMEKKIWELDQSIDVVYCSLTSLTSVMSIGRDKALFLNNMEIAVVYFREGYSPEHYPSQKEWTIRLDLERSKAIKCPTVHYQLAGTKKIQQELARQGAVERYISDEKEAAKIRSVFAGQFSLDLDPDGDRNAEMAINNPGDYVLKPQREGGGNNHYDDEIKTLLTELKNDTMRAGYVLMEKIYPWVQNNYLIKVGESIDLREVVSEIGIYGTVLGSAEEVIENEEVGHLMRTKYLGVNEGGVNTGYSCLDTPFLIE